jgi:UDP-N-acetylglucosamine acyltransferase
MANIHATAVVDPSAKLGTGVEIGPFCLIGPDVELGDGVAILSHAVITGRTTLGADCRVYPFASIGQTPQDVKYHGEPSTLSIGPKTIIREHVTVNPGTEGGHMATKVGANCLLMIGAHVAHDCELGDNVTLVNGATLGGHVTIGEGAIIGGLSAVHQFVRIGAYAFVGGMSGVAADLIPFGMAIDKARFRRPVVPGDTVHYHVQKMRNRGRVWRFRAQAHVDGTLVAEAEVSAVIVET